MSRRSFHRIAAGSVLAMLEIALLLGGPSLKSAHAFGTYRIAGQNAEHERITRIALECDEGEPDADHSCFQEESIKQLAGWDGGFGAVGIPDLDKIPDGSAHCDNADYLDVDGYPQSRESATRELVACVEYLKGQFDYGVDAATGMLGVNFIDPEHVDLNTNCTFVGGFKGRAKCNAIEGLGRALHGVQDFYAHSNWVEESDIVQPVGIENPPGLRRRDPAPFLELVNLGPFPVESVPVDLTTGCFDIPGGCSGRISHGALNKDTGTIGSREGNLTYANATTLRGKVEANFWHAVNLAIIDTRRQWDGFRQALISLHGDRQGERIACAMTRDDPVRDC